MEYRIKGHHDCVACSENGFLLRGFIYSEDRTCIHADMLMGGHAEGWVGIPHGGVGMGALIELVYGLGNLPSEAHRLFPLNAGFRLGGSRVGIGDQVSLKVFEREGGAEGAIYAPAGNDPYMTMQASYHTNSNELIESFESYLPRTVRDLEAGSTPLPRYERCLVCGYNRKFPGLNRGFRVSAGDPRRVVFSCAGFDSGDMDNFFWFKKGGCVHPVALFSLLDEVMGWGGFFIAGEGGVTVKIEFSLLREIAVGERLIALGRGERMVGKDPRLMFFWSSGGMAVQGADGDLETVAVSQAQYLVKPDLTQQMRAHLKPEELMIKSFELASMRPF